MIFPISFLFATILQQETLSVCDHVATINKIFSVKRISDEREACSIASPGNLGDNSVRFVVSKEDLSIWLTFGNRVSANLNSSDFRLKSLNLTPDDAQMLARDARRGEGISRQEAEVAFHEYWEILFPGVKVNFSSVTKSENEWSFQGEPDLGNKKFLSECDFMIIIDSDKGQYKHGYFLVPDLSLADSPTVTLDQGQQSALDAYSRYQPFAHGRIRITWEALGIPGFMEPHEMTEEHGALARAKKAIPMIATHIEDADAIDPKTGKCLQWQTIYVDARDGHAIAIDADSVLSSNALPKSIPSSFKSGTNVTVLGSTSPMKAELKSVAAPKRKPAACKVTVLKVDKELWRFELCLGGLLRTGTKDNYSYWKPGKALSKTLRAIQLQPPKLFGSNRY